MINAAQSVLRIESKNPNFQMLRTTFIGSDWLYTIEA
jgi:hypothetical protein